MSDAGVTEGLEAAGLEYLLHRLGRENDLVVAVELDFLPWEVGGVNEGGQDVRKVAFGAEVLEVPVGSTDFTIFIVEVDEVESVAVVTVFRRRVRTFQIESHDV